MVSVLSIAIAVALIGLWIFGARRDLITWDWSAFVIFAFGWLYVAPTAAAKLTNSYVYTLSLTGEVEVASLGWATQLTRVADFTAIAIAAATIGIAITRRVVWSRVGIAFAAFIGVVTLNSVFQAQQLPSGSVLLLLALVVAAAVTPGRARSVASGAFLFASSFVALGGILTLIRPGAAVLACADKCTIFGEILSGAAPHANSLALISALTIPFGWLLFTGRARILYALTMLLMVSATGSRTALAAAAVIVIVLVVCSPKLEGEQVVGRAAWFMTPVTVVIIGIAAIVPFAFRAADFATGRGLLWQVAGKMIGENIWLGAGLDAWSGAYNGGGIADAAAYSTHNQWVEVALVGGAVGLLMFIVVLFISLAVGGKAVMFATAPILIGIFAIGALERPISISLVNSLTWVLLAWIMLAGSQQINRLPATTALSQSSKDRLPRGGATLPALRI